MKRILLIPLALIGLIIPFARPVAAYPSTNVFHVSIAGLHGVPANAEAVVLNVTATNTESSGYATVWPCGQAKPNASNLNFVAGRDASNAAVIGLGPAGQVCVQASANANLILDVSGYFPAGSPFEPLAPVRIHDTRSGPAVSAGSTSRIQVAGRGGVPHGATSAAMNVTAVSTDGYGYLTVYPCDQPQPNTSNVNYNAGQDVPGMAISRLAADGSVCVFSHGKAHLLVDVTGYFSSGYTPIANPVRVWDSRASGPVGAGGTLQQPIAGNAGVPTDASAVVLNVTATRADAAGFVTAHPCSSGRPNASNVNYTPGQDVANMVIVSPNACLYTSASSSLIVDVFGYFPANGLVTITPIRLLDTRTIPAPAPAPALAPAPAPVPAPAPAPAPSGGGGDLDCSDIRRKVWVGDNDPHRLDADGDGWGCESYG